SELPFPPTNDQGCGPEPMGLAEGWTESWELQEAKRFLTGLHAWLLIQKTYPCSLTYPRRLKKVRLHNAPDLLNCKRCFLNLPIWGRGHSEGMTDAVYTCPFFASRNMNITPPSGTPSAVPHRH
ncbi:MAG: hypothetical protein U0J65_10810, partial [Christensenellales bacterium]|nr:hypothetical protein [Christensenellales bacterium]